MPVEDAVNTWRMERDPKVLAREKRFRQQLFRNIENEFHKNYSVLSRYSLRDYPRITAEKKLLDQLEKEYLSSHPPEERTNLQNDPIYKELSRRSRENFALFPDHKGLWLAGALYHSGKLGTIEQSFARGETVTVFSLREMESIFGGFIPPEYEFNPNRPSVVCSLRTGINGSRVWSLINVTQPDSQKQDYNIVGQLGLFSEYSIKWLFLGEKQGNDIQKPSLGAEAIAWFGQECEAMANFLQSPHSEGVIRSKDKVPFADISTLIEAWSQSQNAEAIMELFPAREVMDQRTLGFNYRRENPAGKRPNEETDEAPKHNLPPHPLWDQQVPQGTTLKAVFQDNLIGDLGAWTLREQNDVLLVTNRWAFLDRYHPFPLAAFLRLEAEWKKYRQTGGSELIVPEELVADYLRTASQTQNMMWTKSLDRKYYRRVPINDIANQLPMLRLWQTLPEQRRRELLAALKDKSVLTLSASEFSARALEELERENRLWSADTYPWAWLPDHLSVLRRGNMKIETRSVSPLAGEKVGQTAHFLHHFPGMNSIGAYTRIFRLASPR